MCWHITDIAQTLRMYKRATTIKVAGGIKEASLEKKKDNDAKFVAIKLSAKFKIGIEGRILEIILINETLCSSSVSELAK